MKEVSGFCRGLGVVMLVMSLLMLSAHMSAYGEDPVAVLQCFSHQTCSSGCQINSRGTGCLGTCLVNSQCDGCKCTHIDSTECKCKLKP
jgi:hypothetical protein